MNWFYVSQKLELIDFARLLSQGSNQIIQIKL